MRTHLTGAIAVAGLFVATSLMAQMPAPTPAAPPVAAQPDQTAVPPETTAPPEATAPDTNAAAPADSSTTPMAPKKHHHHWHKASTTADNGDADTGHWAHEPGTGMSGPASNKASNIDSADTRSTIAPHLPQPPAGEGADPAAYLHDAATALDKHQTGAAQQALEMAETRILTRSTPVSTAGQPAQDPMIQHISDARKALGTNDITGAKAAIQAALSNGT